MTRGQVGLIKNIKGVYFDAGGTLLHPYPSVGEIYAEVLKRWGVDLSPDALQASFKSSWTRLTHTPKNFTTEASEKQWWSRLVRMTLGEHPGPADFDAFFEDLYEAFASVEYWKLHDGALDCIRELRRRGCKTGIISNWDHRLRRILAGTELPGLMDEIIVSCEFGCEKPDVRIFEEGARRWDLSPSQLLYIGDSLHHDVKPCLALGWSAWLIHPHEPAPAGVSVVESFAAVNALLAEGA
jgi:putative hydrolase of the HAD superfamily